MTDAEKERLRRKSEGQEKRGRKKERIQRERESFAMILEAFYLLAQSRS